MKNALLGQPPYIERQAAMRAFTAARTVNSEDELSLVEHEPEA